MSSICILCANFWEEHKKQHLDASVSSSGSQRVQMTMSAAKEKGKFEDSPKSDITHMQRGDQNEVQGTQSSRGLLLSLCFEYCPKTK
ncbi:rCG51470 [Rattus norvegicus]|uniref:RCG51470 n=1 Tax=Rattus norvegicus TaxID=10116 RepID=A6IYH2_RAT|nr:rCG51470 [Rattus norvegicus]